MSKFEFSLASKDITFIVVPFFIYLVRYLDLEENWTAYPSESFEYCIMFKVETTAFCPNGRSDDLACFVVFRISMSSFLPPPRYIGNNLDRGGQ